MKYVYRWGVRFEGWGKVMAGLVKFPVVAGVRSHTNVTSQYKSWRLKRFIYFCIFISDFSQLMSLLTSLLEAWGHCPIPLLQLLSDSLHNHAIFPVNIHTI